jgi:hypothetical protein
MVGLRLDFVIRNSLPGDMTFLILHVILPDNPDTLDRTRKKILAFTGIDLSWKNSMAKTPNGCEAWKYFVFIYKV